MAFAYALAGGDGLAVTTGRYDPAVTEKQARITPRLFAPEPESPVA